MGDHFSPKITQKTYQVFYSYDYPDSGGLYKGNKLRFCLIEKLYLYAQKLSF